AAEAGRPFHEGETDPHDTIPELVKPPLPNGRIDDMGAGDYLTVIDQDTHPDDLGAVALLVPGNDCAHAARVPAHEPSRSRLTGVPARFPARCRCGYGRTAVCLCLRRRNHPHK